MCYNQVSVQELVITREVVNSIATQMNPNGGRVSKIKSVNSRLIGEIDVDLDYEIGTIIMMKDVPYQLDVIIKDPLNDKIIYQVHKYEEARQQDHYGNEVFAVLPLVTMVESESSISLVNK